ncbi:MAG TPA: hypothetical protein GYA08_25370 [Chloroflexi bacterium]|nr:hypothetical protein [Chloroflexota bacterium]
MKPGRTLELPETIANRFQPSDRFIVWIEDDMVLLKYIESASLLRAVADLPDGDEPMTLDEISAIVHEVRQRHHTRVNHADCH